MNENTIEMTTVVQNECTEDTSANKEEKQEKLFTQSQLEEIIRERLMRERKGNESLLAVKKLLKSASEKGLVRDGSYADMASELVKRLTDSAKTEGEDMEKTTPCAENETDTGAAADGENNVTDDGNTADEVKSTEMDFIGILSHLKQKYPEKALARMLEGNSFERFAKGRSGSMEEIFDDFYSFMEDFSGNGGNVSDEDHSALSSTAFSSHSGASDSGAKLTKQQMEIAKGAGMSYREYADLLESIPKKAGRTI